MGILSVIAIVLGQLGLLILLVLFNFRLVELRRKLGVTMPVDRLDYAMTAVAMLLVATGWVSLLIAAKP